MSKHFVYIITITNFRKHNANLKKGHKATLINNNFCTDPELKGAVPMSTRWMLLGIILACGDLNSSTVRISAKDLRDLLECNRNIDRELDSLKELQILSYEKFDLLNNRKEYKIKEKEIKGNGEAPVVSSFENSPGESETETPQKSLLQISNEFANEFFIARRKCGNNADDFAKYVGEPRMAILSAVGGRKVLMDLADNSYESKRLADQIHIMLQAKPSLLVGC